MHGVLNAFIANEPPFPARSGFSLDSERARSNLDSGWAFGEPC